MLQLAGEPLNILFRMQPCFYLAALRPAAEEALQEKSALALLEHHLPVPLPLRFDVALTVTGLPSLSVGTSTHIKDSGLSRSPASTYAMTIAEICTTAIGSRRFNPNPLVWCAHDGTATILLSVLHDDDARSRVLVGPPIEDVDGVARFDLFWGKEITSTRQFPDGSVNQCVVWDLGDAFGPASTARTLPSPAVIAAHMLEYALKKHLSAPALRCVVSLGKLHDVVKERVGAEWRDAVPIVEERLQKAIHFIRELIETLPESHVPCKIASFDVISATEYHSECFPVRPNLALLGDEDALGVPALSVTPAIEPLHCVLSIDDTHKIPDQLDAIQVMKGAISAQLAKAIRVRAETLRSRGPSGNGSDSIATLCSSAYIDVTHRGFLFRIHLAHYREVSLLRAMARTAEADLLERKLFWSQQHVKFIRSVAHGHPSYSLACRLAKRWVSAMLLSDFILPEAIELLTATAYLGSRAPRTFQLGFLLFLQLLAYHHWGDEPLVMPTVSPSEIPSIHERREVSMWIAAPYCPTGSPFTMSTPKKMILHRVTSLAEHGIAAFYAAISGSAPEEATLRSLFKASPHDFDVQLTLHPKLLIHPDRCVTIPAAVSSLDAQPRRVFRMHELDGAEAQRFIEQLVELEPAAHCVRALRMRTRETCMVMYDSIGPAQVYAILLSSTTTPQAVERCRNALLAAAPGAFIEDNSPPPPAALANKTPKSRKTLRDAHEEPEAREEERQGTTAKAQRKSISTPPPDQMRSLAGMKGPLASGKKEQKKKSGGKKCPPKEHLMIL
jgi:hypothetical protein